MLTAENIAEITKNVSKKENQEVLELFTTYYSRISKFDEYDDRIKFVILRDEILKRMEGK